MKTIPVLVTVNPNPYLKKRPIIDPPVSDIVTSNIQPKKYKSDVTNLTNLGRLRSRSGIRFSWIGQQLPTENYEIGRVYFNGFTLCGKDYYGGNVVKMKTTYLSQTVRILSVFQATKSFQGNAYGDGQLYEIQKRGKSITMYVADFYYF